MLKPIYLFLFFNTFYGNVFCQLDIKEILASGLVTFEEVKMRIMADPSECGIDMKILMNGAQQRQGWALKMMDASGKLPQGLSTFNLFEIGNFDNCLTIYEDLGVRIIEGKHCMASIEIPDTNLEMFKVKEISEDLTYEWGMCAPKTCKAENLNYYFGDVVQKVAKIPTEVVFDDKYCRTNEGYKPSGYDIAIIVFLALLLLIVIASTIYEIVIRKVKEEKPNQFLIAFSLWKNSKTLFHVVEVDDTKIFFYSINGLKVFLMFWVLYSHITVNFVFVPALNVHKFVEFTQEWRGVILLGGIFTIDGFFFMSGFLCSYQILKKNNGKLKLKSIPIYLIGRYIRLMPVIFVTSMLMLVIGHATNDTSVANKKFDYFVKDCEKYWWMNHLTVQQYWKPENMCNPPSWFSSVDFHYFFITMFILFAAGYCNMLMYILPAILALASTISSVVTTVLTKIPAMFRIGEYNNMKKYLIYQHICTHQRGASFFMGVSLGYYMWKRGGERFELKKVTVVLLWIAALILLIGSFLFTHYFSRKEYKFSVIADPIYMGLHRIIFLIGFTILFILCEYGYGSFLGAIFKYKYLQIYSKLTFSCYIIQILYIYIFFCNQNTLMNYSQFSVFEKLVSITAVLTTLSAIMYLTVELPFYNLFLLLTSLCKKKDEGSDVESRSAAPEPRIK